MKNIRLPEKTLMALVTHFRAFFLSDDSLWLFGSRVYPEKKGGDIDLYIETHLESFSLAVDKKIAFLCAVQKEIGFQKIDVVLRLLSSDYHLPIYDVARSEGVKLL